MVNVKDKTLRFMTCGNSAAHLLRLRKKLPLSNLRANCEQQTNWERTQALRISLRSVVGSGSYPRVPLGKSLNLPTPAFPHLENEAGATLVLTLQGRAKIKSENTQMMLTAQPVICKTQKKLALL